MTGDSYFLQHVRGEQTSVSGTRVRWAVIDGIMRVDVDEDGIEWETLHFRLVPVVAQWIDVKEEA